MRRGPLTDTATISTALPRVAPILKWVGGKRKLLQHLVQHLPDDFSQRLYCEPFLGGGALLFALRPPRAVVNDSNDELINVYRVVRDSPSALIESLRQHENRPEHFYRVRAMDRDGLYGQLDDVERASRIIYLNKTCFNGLYRVNRRGEFNSPFGFYQRPNIVNEQGIHAMSSYLRQADITLRHGDYLPILHELPEQAFAYIDPPYHPVSATANFTGYVRNGWREGDQVRLRDACNALSARGVRFMLSNSDTELIRELYAGYRCTEIMVRRSVSARATGRKPVGELIVCNY